MPRHILAFIHHSASSIEYYPKGMVMVLMVRHFYRVSHKPVILHVSFVKLAVSARPGLQKCFSQDCTQVPSLLTPHLPSLLSCHSLPRFTRATRLTLGPSPLQLTFKVFRFSAQSLHQQKPSPFQVRALPYVALAPLDLLAVHWCERHGSSGHPQFTVPVLPFGRLTIKA